MKFLVFVTMLFLLSCTQAIRPNAWFDEKESRCVEHGGRVGCVQVLRIRSADCEVDQSGDMPTTPDGWSGTYMVTWCPKLKSER